MSSSPVELPILFFLNEVQVITAQAMMNLSDRATVAQVIPPWTSGRPCPDLRALAMAEVVFCLKKAITDAYVQRLETQFWAS